MAHYDYKEMMREDIKNWIEENEVEEKDFDSLYDLLWVADSVTGNASGSYTFNTYEAKEYVTDNLELAVAAFNEFGLGLGEFGTRIANEDWEYLDVTIRCWLLGEVLSEVLEEV